MSLGSVSFFLAVESGLGEERMLKAWRFFLCVILVAPMLRAQATAPVAAGFASDRISPEKMTEYAGLAVQWEQEYLRVNTTNPPGNELAAARWLKQIFDAEGIENQ